MIQIHHNGTFDIALGGHRDAKNWKNRQIQWSEFLNKISVTHHTAETHKTYMAAKRERQDEIKDIGGFVGGYLNGGRRLKGSVLHRQLVTLDLDFASQSVWEDFTMLYDCAAAMYSTHKHTPEAPRLRLIIPLDREVAPDEYIAIGRRIAGNLDIEMFDHTGYQPSRLMYWPSTSKDGVFEFQYQDGPWLSADEVLSSYRNWWDSSEWPMGSRDKDSVQRDIKKQGDPLEKPGLIGAFCRTYTISQVIEKYLSEVYEVCDIEDRYTYVHGSTSAGLVTYEDKYAYSHHGTDPTSGKLCNAFDLVRLHLYGLQDEDAKEGTAPNRLPSYTAMVDLASKDVTVRRLLGTERLQDAKHEFDGIPLDEPAEELENNNWLEDLEYDRKGNLLGTIDNVVTILAKDPNLKNRLAYNNFDKREVALKHLPWRHVTKETRNLTDADDASIRHYLEKTYTIHSAQKVKDAMDISMRNNAFHPVQDYLNSLTWDGIPRLETVFIDYLGAEDTELTRAFTRKSLTAAVTRIFRPGCKFDYVVVMVGEQGKKKSSLIDALGGDWFSDSFSTIQGKEAYEQLQGVWLVEMGELAGLKKADVETIKHFITKRVDRYRVAYGRRMEDFPRQCVFFASTNKPDFLRDSSGNRRFWPIPVHMQPPTKDVFIDMAKDTEAGRYERAQIWAEAVELYKAGEPLYLTPELEALAAQVQEGHSEVDERTGMIARYLDMLLPDNWDDMNIYERRAFIAGDDITLPIGAKPRTKVCIAEIWCEVLNGQHKDLNKFNTKELHDIMRTMPGWADNSKSPLRFGNYGTQRGYKRVGNDYTKNGGRCTDVNTDYTNDYTKK
ncbi:virulence-associated E family protein [Chitinophaga sp. CC14]|uniref:VapE domain-containing protein n=1 Tax=Chitinophaga sp. CC14 TaxID=3029199 RepID=UPI003B75EFCB